MVKIPIKAESRYPVDRKQIRKTVIEVLKKNRAINETSNLEVSIIFVGDRKMAGLNKHYLKREGTTDVLSFPLTESPFIGPPDDFLRLGDIVISFPQARKQAMQYGRTVDEEINLLVEHGLLHLLGKHHN